MEHIYNLDNNNIVGMWMTIGFMLALLITVEADRDKRSKEAVQFFYDYPYSIGIYIVLGPLMVLFSIKQIMAALKA